ncbi:TPA: site-specific DNA-methyltransferase, partial [Streptococcus suis]|nr:site-specific DNA-methyltransferase [Streptococcus suis]
SFNYHQKLFIKECLDSNNELAYLGLVSEYTTPKNSTLYHAFKPLGEFETKEALTKELDSSPKQQEILNSIFARYVFHLFDSDFIHSFFSGKPMNYRHYYNFIGEKYPDLVDRSNTLVYIDISLDWFNSSYFDGINKIFATINEAYEKLTNYSSLIIHLPDINLLENNIQWRLYKDIVLYSEKFIETKLQSGYFKPEKIKNVTTSTIKNYPNLKFEYVNEGFTYKDTFVLQENPENPSYSLLLIFEKKQKDERLINCPSCWSDEVRGNSYPTLNVKSWECKNPLCPDKSKFNRGKRYSFNSILKQELIKYPSNQIEEKLLKQWHRDCVYDVNQSDVIEMAIKFFSAENDGVTIISTNKNIFNSTAELFNRKLKYFPPRDTSKDFYKQFHNSGWFEKYLIKDIRKEIEFQPKILGKAQIYQGDSLDVLHSLSTGSISAVVTSPPYYNAKEYSQWPNIYCYLYDMFNISAELFRVLSDDGIMLFNIFDYFDNEKTIAQSAMGEKRMILGAYMLDIFEKLGFNIKGNIIWDKGEIQGNRNFNQGNRTPYYQSPLNCWEHVFILSKKNNNTNISSDILQLHPVVKIIKGKNILGHTAPYPDEIPELIISSLEKSDTVLDPFLGSGTTCIVANNFDVNSIGIELNSDYYKLSQKRISENRNTKQLTLFE